MKKALELYDLENQELRQTSSQKQSEIIRLNREYEKLKDQLKHQPSNTE